MSKQSLLEVNIIDVGQGECALIESGGRYILVDCGSSDIKNVASTRIVSCLKYYGVDTLDAIFLTHLDADHCNGLEGIYDSGIKIKNIYYGGLSDMSFKDIDCKKLKAGMQYVHNKAIINVLSPKEYVNYEDENAASLVLDISIDNFKCLFTGDISAKVESELLEELEGDYDCLVSPHHGSGGSNSLSFLEKVKPEVTIISCGVDNSYGHPHQNTLDNLKKVDSNILITTQTGQITLAPFDKNKIRCRALH